MSERLGSTALDFSFVHHRCSRCTQRPNGRRSGGWSGRRRRRRWRRRRHRPGRHGLRPNAAMQKVAALRSVGRRREMRLHKNKQGDGVVARGSSGKLRVQCRHGKAGRRQPAIAGVRRGPLVISVFGQQQQVYGLIREQLVRLVTLLELHRLVANAQRAHLEPAEVSIGRRVEASLRRQKKEERRTGESQPDRRRNPVGVLEQPPQAMLVRIMASLAGTAAVRSRFVMRKALLTSRALPKTTAR
jgi:hypothetical protein